MKSAVWIGLLKYGVGFGLLAYVLYANWKPGLDDGLAGVVARPLQFGTLTLYSGQSTSSELPPIQLETFLAAALLCAVALGLTFVRWWVLVRAQNLPFTLYNAFRLGLVGSYYNAFLPGSIGGDFLKAYSIAKEQTRRTVAVATVLIDRAVGLVALFWLGALVGGVLWLIGDPIFAKPVSGAFLKWLLVVCWGMVGLTVFGWVVLTILPDRRAERFAGRLKGLRWVGGSLSEFWRAVWLYHKQPRALAVALGLSVVGHAGFVFVFYLAALTFADPKHMILPTLGEHYLLFPFGQTFQAFIPTPGGVGAGEVGFARLYLWVGATNTAGVLGSLGNRVILWLLGLVGYIVFLQMRAAHKLPETVPTTAASDPAPQPAPALAEVK